MARVKMMRQATMHEYCSFTDTPPGDSPKSEKQPQRKRPKTDATQCEFKSQTANPSPVAEDDDYGWSPWHSYTEEDPAESLDDVQQHVLEQEQAVELHTPTAHKEAMVVPELFVTAPQPAWTTMEMPPDVGDLQQHYTANDGAVVPTPANSPTRGTLWAKVGRIKDELADVMAKNYADPYDPRQSAREERIRELGCAYDVALDDAKFHDWQAERGRQIQMSATEPPQTAEAERDYMTLEDIDYRSLVSVERFSYLVPSESKKDSGRGEMQNADQLPQTSEPSEEPSRNVVRRVVHQPPTDERGRLLRWNTDPRDAITSRYLGNYSPELLPCSFCALLPVLPWERRWRNTPAKCKCAKRGNVSRAQRKRRRLQYLKNISKINCSAKIDQDTGTAGQ